MLGRMAQNGSPQIPSPRCTNVSVPPSCRHQQRSRPLRGSLTQACGRFHQEPYDPQVAMLSCLSRQTHSPSPPQNRLSCESVHVLEVGGSAPLCVKGKGTLS